MSRSKLWWRVLIVCGLFSWLHPVHPVLAQAAGDPARGASPGPALARLEPGRIVRLATRSHGYLVGAYQGVEHDSVAVAVESAARRLPVAAIDSVWVRSHQAGSGALIGAVAGAVALAGLGQMFNSAMCDSAGGCGGDYPVVVGAGVLVGGSGGALVGAGIGALTRGWKRLHPR